VRRPYARRVRTVVVSALVLTTALVWGGAAQGAAWLPEQEVAPGDAGASQPALAMTPSGDLLVAWRYSGAGGSYGLGLRARKTFTGFTDPQSVGGLEKPRLAADSTGRVWLGVFDAVHDDMFLARSSQTDPGSLTGLAASLPLSGTADLPDVFAQPDYGAIAYVDGSTIKLLRWTAAGGVSNPTMYDGSLGAGRHPRVTVDAAGNLVVGFTYLVGVLADCRANAVRFPAGAATPSSVQDLGQSGIDDFGCNENNDIDLALGPTGRVLASWVTHQPFTITSRIAAPGAAFGPTMTIATTDYDPVTNPEPLWGQPGNNPRAALGASDALLHLYLTRRDSTPSSTPHMSQRFISPGHNQTVTPFENSDAKPDVARNAGEQAVGAWSAFGPDICHVSAAVGTVHDGLGARQIIGGCGSSGFPDPKVAIDVAGDAAAVWIVDGGVWLALYDATPPEVLSMSAPASGTAGDALAFSASSRDAFSSTTTQWDFGDGGTATGGSVQHTYSAPGTYHVVANVHDDANNTAFADRTVVVAPAPMPPGTENGGAGGGGGGGGGGGDGGGLPFVPPPATGPRMALTGSTLRASRRGVVKLTLGCPAGTEGGCHGEVSIPGVASATFTAASGTSTTATLKLNRKARRRLARRHKLAIDVTVTARDGASRVAVVNQRYTLVAPGNS
jgi:PKD repeat protein